MSNYIGSVPDTVARPLDWQERAACQGSDDLFFDREKELDARIVCVQRCPVRTQCLAHIKRLERGDAKERRGGVVAGLTGRERWRLDATAAGHSDRPALVFTGEPPDCGTYTALLRHLWLGELVDAECWSAEVRRDRANRAGVIAEREAKQRAETAADTAAQPKLTPVQAGASCPSVDAYKRHLKAGEPVDPGCRQAYAEYRSALRYAERDRSVYRLWTKGLSDPEIAEHLGIGIRAVRNARDRLGLMPNLHVRKAAS